MSSIFRTSLTLQQIQAHYGESKKVAQAKLGVSRSCLDAHCKCYGIDQWPSRPMKALDDQIAVAIRERDATPKGQKVKELEEKRRKLIENPSLGRKKPAADTKTKKASIPIPKTIAKRKPKKAKLPPQHLKRQGSASKSISGNGISTSHQVDEPTARPGGSNSESQSVQSHGSPSPAPSTLPTEQSPARGRFLRTPEDESSSLHHATDYSTSGSISPSALSPSRQNGKRISRPISARSGRNGQSCSQRVQIAQGETSPRGRSSDSPPHPIARTRSPSWNPSAQWPTGGDCQDAYLSGVIPEH